MNKNTKTIRAWALLSKEEMPIYPLYRTKKEAKKRQFVEDLAKIEIKIIKKYPLKTGKAI